MPDLTSGTVSVVPVPGPRGPRGPAGEVTDAQVATALAGSQSGAVVQARVDAAVVSKPVALSGKQGGGREYPTLSKYAANPVATKADATSLGSIYWPWVVRLADHGVTVGGHAFALYYSTDHSAGDGDPGIGLLTSATPYGPWTDRGVVYRDLAGGTQTETPSVTYNENTSLWHLYYQQAGAPGAVGIQSTCLATSPDGVTWTRVGITHDVILNRYPGSGHTGYFRPFRYGNTWFGYSLLGSGNYARYGLSFSTDNGLTWSFDPRPLGSGAGWLPDGGTSLKVKWNSGIVFEWRGALWGIFAVGPNASGGVDVVHQWWCGPLRPDLRDFAAAPVNITPPSQAWESSPEVALDGPSSVIEYDGKLLFFYRGGGDSGGFGIAELDLSAAGVVPVVTPLPAGSPKRDLRGEIVWPGRTRKVWTEDFDQAALPTPTFLDVPTASSYTGQTVAYSSPGLASGTGSARATTATGTVNRLAGFEIKGYDGNYVDLRGLDAIRLTVEGMFVSSAANTEVTLGLAAADGKKGVLLRQTAEPSAQVYTFNAAGALPVVSTQFLWKDSQDYGKRHNVSLVVFRRTKWVMVMENDQIVYAGYHPDALFDGPVVPKVTVKTISGAVEYLDITQIKLERWIL
jgi:hypothetical protein